MKRLLVVMVGALCMSALTGCGGGDSPETAVREWLQAAYNMDGNKLMERTCATQQANVQQAGLWLSAFGILGQQAIGEKSKGDVSSLQFETISSGSNRAQVRVRGEVRIAILAVAQVQKIDQTIPAILEDGKWKVCE